MYFFTCGETHLNNDPKQFGRWTFSGLAKLAFDPRNLSTIPMYSNIRALKQVCWWFTPSDCPTKTKADMIAHGNYCLLVADLDYGNHTQESVAETLANIGIQAFIIYDTVSSTTSNRRSRVVIELTEPVGFEQWLVLQRTLIFMFGADDAMDSANQISYMPTLSAANAECYQATVSTGEPLHPYDSKFAKLAAELEAQYPDENLKIISKADKASTPPVDLDSTEYLDPLSVFNQVKPWDKLLRECGFKKCYGNRWLPPTSQSGVAGAFISTKYRSEGAYVSSHSSDPLCDGRAHSKLDVYMVHGLSLDPKNPHHQGIALGEFAKNYACCQAATRCKNAISTSMQPAKNWHLMLTHNQLYQIIDIAESSIIQLIESAKAHCLLFMTNNIELLARLAKITNKRADNIEQEIKALGKQPRKSRSKDTAKATEQEAKRLLHIETKEQLLTEKTEQKQRARFYEKALRQAERITEKGQFDPLRDYSIPDPVLRFYRAYQAMIKAEYQERMDSQKYLPTYGEVFEILREAMQAGAAIELECYRGWNNMVEQVNGSLVQQGLGIDSVKKTLAYMAASRRAFHYPHNLSLDQVFDGLGDEDWEAIIRHRVTNEIIERHAAEARKCTRLDECASTTISHVSEVAEAIYQAIRSSTIGTKKKFYLSTPMGGVFNAAVNGIVHNSGSKTNGVLLPSILAALDRGEYVTVIVHRVSLTYDLEARTRSYLDSERPNVKDPVWHYQTKTVFGLKRVLITCVNSLNRPEIREFLVKCSVILIDEFTQVINNIQLMMDTDEALPTFDLLMEAVADQSKTIVALDADLDGKTIDIIGRFTHTWDSCGRYNILHPERLLSHQERSKIARFHRNKGSQRQAKHRLHELAKKRLEAKKMGKNADRFFIAVDNRALSVSFAEYCKVLGLSVCLINADTTQANDVSEDAARLMSGKCSPDAFDAVIYSPSVTSGVSWESPAFQGGCVLACCTIPSGDLKQMCFRFRHAKRVDIFNMQSLEDMAANNIENDKATRPKAKEYNYGDLFLELQQHRRELAYSSTKNQLQYLAHQLEAEGWGIVTIDHTSQKNTVAEDFPTLNQSARTEAIMESKQLTAPEYKRISSRAYKSRTHADVLAAERYCAAVYGMVSHNEIDVRTYLSSNTERCIKAFQSELLPATHGHCGPFVREMMAELVSDRWLDFLTDGTNLKLDGDHCHNFLMAAIQDPVKLNTLHSFGAFDNSRESNRKRGLRRNGPPINDTVAVISYQKAAIDPCQLYLWVKGRLTPPFEAFLLFDGNVLVVNTEPKRCTIAIKIVKRLLRACGIPADSNKGILEVKGNVAARIIAAAKRRAVARTISDEISDAEGSLRTLSLECRPNGKAGFSLTLYANGELHVSGTQQIIDGLSRGIELTEPGWVADSPASQLGDAIRLAPFKEKGGKPTAASNHCQTDQSVRFTLSEKSSTKFTLAERVEIILPWLLTEPRFYDSMLADLKLTITPVKINLTYQ